VSHYGSEPLTFDLEDERTAQIDLRAKRYVASQPEGVRAIRKWQPLRLKPLRVKYADLSASARPNAKSMIQLRGPGTALGHASR
jgi:hypothetical protein